MVVEELVAKLGFKATGLGDLRKFERGLDGAKGRLRAFGTTLNQAFGAGLARDAVAFLPKLGNALKAGTAMAGAFAATLVRVSLVAGLVAGGIGLVTVAVLKMGAALVRSRGQAALLRRELQIQAAGNRTTAGNIDALGKGMEAVGPGGGEALKKGIGDLAEKVNEAVKDLAGDVAEKFKKLGVGVLDKRGNQRDTAAVFDDVVKAYLERQAKVRDARASAEADPNNKRRLAQANKDELAFRKDQDEYPGLSKDLRDLLGTLKSYSEYDRKRQDANSRNPGRTAEQEAQDKQIAEGYRRLQESLAALQQPLEKLSTLVTTFLLPPLTSLAEALVTVGKKLGWINSLRADGQDEADARRETQVARERSTGVDERALERALADFGEVKQKSGSGSWWQRVFGLGTADKGQISDIQGLVSRYNAAKAKVGDDDPGTRGADGEALRSAAAALLSAIESLKTSQYLDESKRPRHFGPLANLDDVKSANSPAGAARAANENLSVALTGSAEVKGSASVGVTVTASPELLRVVADAKKANVELRGTLRANGGGLPSGGGLVKSNMGGTATAASP